MNAGNHQSPHDRETEENDPLWQLLGRASVPDPGAWFTVLTLARCYKEGGKSSLASLRHIWRWALGGGLGFGLALVLLVAQIHTDRIQNPTAQTGQTDQTDQTVDNQTKQQNVQEAFEIMASVDSDTDSSSSSSSSSSSYPWQDSSL
jgi:hypothetical protein